MWVGGPTPGRFRRQSRRVGLLIRSRTTRSRAMQSYADEEEADGNQRLYSLSSECSTSTPNVVSAYSWLVNQTTLTPPIALA